MAGSDVYIAARALRLGTRHGGLTLSPVMHGLWQLEGMRNFNYTPRREETVADMVDCVQRGLGTFELCSAYLNAQELVGDLHQELGRQLFEESVTGVYTWAPRIDAIPGGALTSKFVEDGIDEMLLACKVDYLDLVQLHWRPGAKDGRLVAAFRYLEDLKSKGKIRAIGAANFGAEELELAYSEGISLATNMVALSLIDRRALRKVAALCEQNGTKLIAYGTLLGGLMTQRFMGSFEPTMAVLDGVAQQKYWTFLQRWGPWSRFQELLFQLKHLGEKYGCSAEQVAMKWALDQRNVGAIVVGSRFGYRNYIHDKEATLRVRLTDADTEILEYCAKLGNDLFDVFGDCGNEFRPRT
ncbi:putative oxidoreductase YdjG [Porphyridium purpureum]|uniref:Putative oxidoreductase YdjG n=1 Tax=Porphyridium purpureum TaxID=35688 RepID=A0A5J4YVU7_PORPP|nr:putative oxidoreductase YdjG [Porphyridium purpureum]|eukprot:POR8404..scf209_3